MHDIVNNFANLLDIACSPSFTRVVKSLAILFINLLSSDVIVLSPNLTLSD